MMRAFLAFAIPGLLGACAPERECRPVLWWVGQAGEVSVIGDFNGWNAEADPLEWVEAERAWRIQLDLPSGDYRYLFVVDGAWQPDPFQPLLSWDPMSQEERSLLRVADCSEPALELRTATASADGDLEVEATFLRSSGGSRLVEVQAELWDGSPVQGETHPASGEISIRASDLPPGKHTVRVVASDGDGGQATLTVPLWVEERPFDWSDALVYQVVTDRFSGPDGELPETIPSGIGARAGGTLAGLTEVLRDGYFEALGVNALWISPVYLNPEGWWTGRDGHSFEAYHGYWPISTTEVEPAIGGADALEALVVEAHARGIRVILDVVPNHLHEQHPWYLEHAEDWFHLEPGCVCGDYDCPWSTDIETCWFAEYLPDLALERTEVVRAVMESTVDWAARYDLDGFRVDAVPMMPRAAIRELEWSIQRVDPQGDAFWTVGETYTGQDFGAIRVNLGPFGLDGQFEFPTMWALRGFAAWGSQDAAALENTIALSEIEWEGSGSVMAPFVGNHDVSRFLSEAAGSDTTLPWDDPPPTPTSDEPYQKLLLAQAIALTLPGAPVLYYGDEYGLAGANDPDCRRTMRFTLDERQAWVLERVQRLGRARACTAALREGDRVPLLADGPVYAHLRDSRDGAPALTVVNASASSVQATLVLPPETVSDTTLVEVIEGVDTLSVSGGQPSSLDLPPWSARVFVPENPECP